jgi:endo-1,4-beta-mannosidase
MPEPFVLGVNYWPRRKAMYWWSAFDAGEVRDEFALIRALGLSLVRIFLLWDDFQPAPDQHRNHLGDQRSFAGAAPAREPDNAHDYIIWIIRPLVPWREWCP